MVDAISQKFVAEVGNLAEKATERAVERSPVSSADAASFQTQVNGAEAVGMDAAAVSAASASTQATATAPASVATSATTNATATAPNMGDRILSGLEGMSNDMQATRQKFVQDVSGNGKVSEMYKLQLEVAQMTTNQTIIGQAGSKTSQGIQTLLKGQ